MEVKPGKKFRRGPYYIHHETWTQDGSNPTTMKIARTHDGLYIGETRFAYRLWKKYGIETFELRTPTSNVCSVGFSSVNGKWYGWSHRAIFGFKTREEAAKFADEVS